VTGVSAAPIVIPRGQNEVKLALRVDPNAAPGNRANLGVRVTATFLKRPVVQESQKFNLNVVK
jgi:hypothetical protein